VQLICMCRDRDFAWRMEGQGRSIPNPEYTFPSLLFTNAYRIHYLEYSVDNNVIFIINVMLN